MAHKPTAEQIAEWADKMAEANLVCSKRREYDAERKRKYRTQAFAYNHVARAIRSGEIKGETG